jgi:hypothetical protein
MVQFIGTCREAGVPIDLRFLEEMSVCLVSAHGF